MVRARVDRAHLAFTSANAPDTAYPRPVDNAVARGVVSNSCADDFRMLLTLGTGFPSSGIDGAGSAIGHQPVAVVLWRVERR